MQCSRRYLIALFVAALCLPLGAFADTAAAQQAVTVKLEAQNSSGLSGTATLTPLGDQTRVVIAVTGSGAVPMPSHIHAGTCANLNAVPAYPLTATVNGASETVVNVKLADLQKSPMAINLHKSPQEIAIYVACGNIPLAAAVAPPAPVAAPAAQPAQLPRTGEGSFSLVGLTALGALLALAGLASRSRSR